MKQLRNLVAAALFIAPAVAFSVAPPPEPPDITITYPTTGTTLYVNFPYTVQVAFTLDTSNALNNQGVPFQLKDVVQLDVAIGTTALWPEPVNPFTNANACKSDLLAVATSCTPDSTHPTHKANIVVPWVVTGPGTYSVTVSAKLQGDEGYDSEYNIQLLLLVAEYPAPPSVANAYIKTQFGKLSTGVRGCVISAIANNHAQDSKYGPKGGPYDLGMIQSDVSAYASQCTQ
jgi:hypothetical protein